MDVLPTLELDKELVGPDLNVFEAAESGRVEDLIKQVQQRQPALGQYSIDCHAELRSKSGKEPVRVIACRCFRGACWSLTIDPSGLFLRAPGQPGFDSGSDPTCQDAMDFWNAVGPLGVIGSPPTDPFTQSMSACLGTNFIPWGTALGGAGGGASAGWSRDVAVDAAMRASDLIESPDCAGMFLSPSANTAEQRQMLSEQLQYVADSGDLRVISPNALPQGTSPNVPAFTTGTWGFIYVVSGSAFFTNTTPTGQSLGGAFQGLTLSQTQELIVVHEFLHWEGVGPDNAGQTYILPNGDKVTGSQGISNEVRKKCFK